ncbi:MAG: alpha-amylase [Anaerolineae bacterium]|nr:alpha-amylase [Anaerolineae bacterium]
MKIKATFLLSMLLLTAFILGACTPTTPPVPEKASAEDYGYPWWNDRVFYQIFVRSFYDSDGDGVGDFAGITEKLDYLNDGDPATNTDLGITGIWLMPILPSPSYHGYDVTDYKAVNPDYGTMEDFQALLAACHERGIAVIIDWEINHTSDQHPWFVAAEDPASDYHDWYIWEETSPGYSGPWGQGVWHRSQKAELFYYGIFTNTMPDLNFNNRDVTTAMYDAVAFWIEEIGVDGLRIDAARHLIEEGKEQANTASTHAWYQAWYPWYKGINPDAMMIGEVWDASLNAAKFVDDQELDLVFNFDLAGKFTQAASMEYSGAAASALENELKIFPDYQMGTFLTNHDMARFMTTFMPDYGKPKTAATLLLTAPGVPFLYYGEEIGMVGGKPDENIRRPMQWDGSSNAGFTSAFMPWMTAQPDYTEKNVAQQTEDETSLLSHYRKLIHFRNTYPALKIGDTHIVGIDNAGVYAILRSTEEQTFLVVANMTAKPIDTYTLNLAQGPLQAGKSYRMVEFFSAAGNGTALKADENGGFADYSPLDVLEPYTTYIFWLK